MECGICLEGNDTKYSDFESFKAHLIEEHSSNAVDVFACHECEKAFRTKKAYCDHRRGHDPTATLSQVAALHHGLACSDCGLYLRTPNEESAEEWSAFCRIMATHSPAHLVLVRVHSAVPLKDEPTVKVNLPIKLARSTSQNEACQHCKVVVKGRTAMKKHLLEGKCIPRMPTTALALLVIPENSIERVNKKRARTKRVLRKEGMKWRKRIEAHGSNRQKWTMNKERTVGANEVVELLIRATIPIFRSAMEISIAYTPNGAVKALYCCKICKLIIGMDAGFDHKRNGKICPDLVQHHGRLPSNSLIPCKECTYSVCSVLGLQTHRSLEHNEDLTIHPGMEKERTECMPSPSKSVLRKGQEGRQRQESSSSTGENSSTSSQATISRKRQASTSSAGAENTAPVPPKQRKEMLHTDPSTGLPVVAVPDTTTPSLFVPKLYLNLLRPSVTTKAGPSDSSQPSPQTSVSNQTPSELEDQMEASDAESFSGRNGNGVAAASKEKRLGSSAQENTRPKMTLLDCYIKPPTSSYLPKEGFFRLCRLCMTAMPADEEIWLTHMKKHKCGFKDRRYSCSDCSLMLTLEELKRHQQEHFLTCIQCTPCKKNFADDVIYYLHLAETHAVDLVHFCKMCSIATKSAEQLREHIHSRACKTTKSNTMEPMPGVIGECLVTFEGGLEPGSEFVPHFAKHFDRKSNRCKIDSCARRSLTLPSEKEAMGKQTLTRMMLRARINVRASCPVDLFPIAHCSYSYSEHERPHVLLRTPTEEQKKDFGKQLKEVSEGRNGISGIHSLASYMRLPRRTLRISKSIISASSTAAAAAAATSSAAAELPTQNGVVLQEADQTPIAVVPTENGASTPSDSAEAAADEQSASTADNTTKKWSVDEIKAKREECRKRYRDLLARVAENFCKYGTDFPYTPEQKRSTRTGIEVNYEQINPVRCFFCLSTRGYYPITEENREEWINCYCTSKGDTMIHGHLNSQFRTTTSEKRVCARHFQLSEIDQDGRLAPTARPGYCERKCITCGEKSNGNEMPIYNKEQLRALADVSLSEASFDELLAKCGEEIQYSCSLCVSVACEAHPDMLPADVREELTRAIAAREAEKAQGKKRKKSAAVPSTSTSTAPTRSSSAAPPEAAEEPSIAQDFVSALHYAAKEPPTPMPPPSTSSRAVDDDEIGDVREPPTPQTQGLLRDFRSATRHAILEPPTPAPAPEARGDDPDEVPVEFHPPQTPGTQSLLRDMNGFKRAAIREPPTPAPPPPRPDDEPKFRPPPTPNTQSLRQTLSSALCDAVLEPPTPAAPPPQSSAAGDVGSDDDEGHLETVKRVLSKDYVPPTPRAQEHVAEITREMLVDAPSTSSMAPPRLPPPQQPSRSTATTAASTSTAPQQPPQLQHVVRHLPQQPTQQQQQRQSVVQPLPVQNQPVQMMPPNPPAQAVSYSLEQLHQQFNLQQQQQAPMTAQQQIQHYTQLRKLLLANQKRRIHEQLQALHTLNPHEQQQWNMMFHRHNGEIQTILAQQAMRIRMLDIEKEKEIEEKQAEHNEQKLTLLQQMIQQREAFRKQQQQAQQLVQQQQQQQAQQQLYLQQQSRQQALLQMQQQQQQHQQVVNAMVRPQQPVVSGQQHIMQMQQQMVQQLMMQAVAHPAQQQIPPAAQRPAPSQAAPAAAPVQQQRQQQQQQRPQQQQQQPAHGPAPRTEPAGMISFIMERAATLQTREELAKYEQTLRSMNAETLKREYEGHWRTHQRHPQQPGPSNAQPGPSNAQPGASNAQPGASNAQPGPSNAQPGPSNAQPGPSNAQPGPSNAQQQQPGPSNSQRSTAAAPGSFGGWEDRPTGETFICRLCCPDKGEGLIDLRYDLIKNANTARVHPMTEDVEQLLDELKIEKGSHRRRILWRHWNGKRRMDKVLICKKHVEETDKGLTCNNCRDYCLAEEKNLHKAEHRFFCQECYVGLKCDHDLSVLKHMQSEHYMQYPKEATYRLDCPLKGDANYSCNHTSTSLDEYKKHLSNFHVNDLPVCPPPNSNHKCNLRFKTDAAMIFHEKRVAEHRARHNIRPSTTLICCPLCGMIEWPGELGEGANKVSVSHYTLHMMDWSPVCKHDLLSTMRGTDATEHFKAIHYDDHVFARDQPCTLCDPLANPEEFDIDAHADSHVIIGLSVPKQAQPVIRSDDTSRALLGLPRK